MCPCSLSFACQVRRAEQQNAAVHCACADVCVGECVDVCLRVCRDVQPGTELLLGGDVVGKGQTADEGDSQEKITGRSGNELVTAFIRVRGSVAVLFLITEQMWT